MKKKVPFIKLEEVFLAHPQARHCRMRPRTSGEGGTGYFMLGYLCAIAFKLGMTTDEIQQIYADLRKEFGTTHVTNWNYVDRLHKVIEERITHLPS